MGLVVKGGDPLVFSWEGEKVRDGGVLEVVPPCDPLVNNDGSYKAGRSTYPKGFHNQEPTIALNIKVTAEVNVASKARRIWFHLRQSFYSVITHICHSNIFSHPIPRCKGTRTKIRSLL